MEMYYYVTRCDDGSVHIQNTLGTRNGQHHVHTKEGYKRWKAKCSARENIKVVGGRRCDCGLVPGQVRRHDGTIVDRE